MQKNEGYSFKKYLALLLSLNALMFLVYYTALYVWRNSATLYIFFYLNEVLNFILPIGSATALFFAYAHSHINKTLLYCLYFSLSWVINLFPYYAFEYSYTYVGLETTAVIGFAALHTLFMTVVLYIETYVLFLLMILVARVVSKRCGNEFNKSDIKCESRFLDLADPVSAAIFSSSFAMFIYNTVGEIIDTVSYFDSVYGVYNTGEIIYILFRYVFILSMIFISHAAAIFIKNKLFTSANKEDI